MSASQPLGGTHVGASVSPRATEEWQTSAGNSRPTIAMFELNPWVLVDPDH
jgi:hypothetical protein